MPLMTVIAMGSENRRAAARGRPYQTFESITISNGGDIVRVRRLMGHANASLSLNIYMHMLPRERDSSGDRLASLVFGNR